MDWDIFTAYVGLLIIGFCLGGFFVTTMGSGEINLGVQGKAAIESCEKTLPRDQHCVLKAVPTQERRVR